MSVGGIHFLDSQIPVAVPEATRRWPPLFDPAPKRDPIRTGAPPSDTARLSASLPPPHAICRITHPARIRHRSRLPWRLPPFRAAVSPTPRGDRPDGSGFSTQMGRLDVDALLHSNSLRSLTARGTRPATIMTRKLSLTFVGSSNQAYRDPTAGGTSNPSSVTVLTNGQ